MFVTVPTDFFKFPSGFVAGHSLTVIRGLSISRNALASGILELGANAFRLMNNPREVKESTNHSRHVAITKIPDFDFGWLSSTTPRRSIAISKKGEKAK
jgi:hypothetical protein